MTGKPDKERMGQDMKYVIDSKVYENHINDEVHLYGLLHQLAFLAGKTKDEEDLDNLAETAKRYGEIAEEKFAAWRIPGRYLVFGDRKDLAELKAAELTPLTAVLKEHDAKIREKQRAAASNDPAYIISGSAFRMLVGDIYNLIVLYHSLARGLSEAVTDKDFLRLKKKAGSYEKVLKKLYRSLGLPEGSGVAHDTLEEAIIKRHHLIPLEEVEDDSQDDGLEGDEVWSD